MNREANSHFAGIPSIDIGRSKFKMPHTVKSSFNASRLYPVYCDMTIMPGDTVKMRMSEIIRMMTPIAPVMDNAWLDVSFWFVPYRLICDKFKAFMGENEKAPWAVTEDIRLPMIENASTTDSQYSAFLPKSIADYMGIPITGKTTKKWKTSALPFRAYCLIWNEFWRDQNLQNPINIHKDTTTRLANASKSLYPLAGEDDIQRAELGNAAPLQVCKFHDYFTSCLPQAQKGPAVTLPMNGIAPVILGAGVNNYTYENAVGTQAVAHWDEYKNKNTSDPDSMEVGAVILGHNGTSYIRPSNADDDFMYYNNTLQADLSKATGATINQLRQAFAIQKFYERQARGGTRYIEMIRSHFDVVNPDFRMQRPEYLGGKRIPININQVVASTAATDQPLGDTGAYSVTVDTDEDLFTHSFTEHGVMLGLVCIRQQHTYQQGLNRQFSMEKLFDFYFPEFANLGEQAVLNKEIYLQGKDEDEEAFGYQEAWANYRYKPDLVTGEMRSNYAQSLDVWHWADNYSQLPSLGDEWIKETDTNIQRTIAVQNHDQFFGDFYFCPIYTRPMPVYSVPGLIDHH